MDKRTFLKNAGLMGLGVTLNFAHLRSVVAAVEGMDPKQVASDEDFWRAVRGDYSIKSDYINLENGYRRPRGYQEDSEPSAGEIDARFRGTDSQPSRAATSQPV